MAICSPGHAHRNSEQNSSSGGVSSPARSSSSWWLQAAMSVHESHSLLLWAFFYRLWREMEPFACQLLMTKWLSRFPYVSKALRSFPNSPLLLNPFPSHFPPPRHNGMKTQ